MRLIQFVGLAPLLAIGIQRVLEEAGFAVCDSEPPDLAVVCIGRSLPVVLSDIISLRRRAPDVRIVLIANNTEWAAADIYAAIEAGVDAYCRDPSLELFIKTIEVVLLGMRVMPRDLTPRVPREEPKDDRPNPPIHLPLLPGPAWGQGRSIGLSEREHIILTNLMKGTGNKQIGRDLGITEATVKVHVKAILRKLGLRNRTQAATYGMRMLTNGTPVTVLGDPIILPEPEERNSPE